MAALGQVGSMSVALLGDISSFNKGLTTAGSKLKSFGTSVANAGKAMTLGITMPLLAIGTASVIAFDKQAKALAQVEAGIISTGGACGFTTEELAKIASGLQDISLYGDEDILIGVTAQLLTFCNIAQEQFAATQVAVLDLATRMGMDLKSASIQLGKALNDPIANLSALSRSGIQFTDVQKDMIKALWESGKMAEAQNVILKELNNQFGGSAEAAVVGAGKITQLKNVIGDLSEEFGSIIMTGITPFIDNLKELAKAAAAMSTESKEKIVKYLAIFAVAGPALYAVGTIAKLVPALYSLWAALAASPIGILVAGAAAAKLLGDHFAELYDTITGYMGDLVKGEQEAIHVTQVIIDEFVTATNDAGNAIINNANVTADTMTAMIGHFRNAQTAAQAALESGELRYDAAMGKFRDDVMKILDDYGVMDDYTRNLFSSMIDNVIASWAKLTGVTLGATQEITGGVVEGAEAQVAAVGEVQKAWSNLDLEAAQKDFDDLSAKLLTTKEGSLDYINVVVDLQAAYKKLKDAEAGIVAQGDDVDAGLSTLISDYEDLGISLGKATTATVSLKSAIADLGASSVKTGKEVLNGLVSSVSNAFSTFFDGISDMKATNEKALEDYKVALQGFADAEGESDKAAAEQRALALRNLNDDLEDGKITREKYGREKAQIEADYSKAVTDAATTRKKAGTAEETAYHEQQVGIEDILGDMLTAFLKAAREQLQLEAAKETVISIANGFILNWAGAAAHAAAAVEYLAGAAALAIAGFEQGGIVQGAPGEPVLAIVHGGERVQTEAQQRMDRIDYVQMGEAVQAGTYDALVEVLGKDRSRPIIVQLADGTRLAQALYNPLEAERARRGG